MPSARLRFVNYIESLQAAGAMFHYTDLSPDDWRDLLTMKMERQRFEREDLARSKRN